MSGTTFLPPESQHGERATPAEASAGTKVAWLPWRPIAGPPSTLFTRACYAMQEIIADPILRDRYRPHFQAVHSHREPVKDGSGRPAIDFGGALLVRHYELAPGAEIALKPGAGDSRLTFREKQQAFPPAVERQLRALRRFQAGETAGAIQLLTGGTGGAGEALTAAQREAGALQPDVESLEFTTWLEAYRLTLALRKITDRLRETGV